METIPPRHSSLPTFGQAFWLNVLSCAATGAAISVFFQKSYGSCGDYPQHFHACWWGMGFGAAAGLIFNFFYPKIPFAFRLQPLVNGFLRYFLAWIMLSYAVAKIIPTQFPYLIANMDSTFSELTPMRVAWTFFGYSKGYQMLMGWAEAIPALLLLFRRTSTLGALLMVPVLVQVAAVNFFFDVCVKLNSTIYLGIAICLLVNEFDRLWAFFISGKNIPARERLVLFINPKTRRIANILNGLLVAGILGYITYLGWEGWHYFQSQDARTPVYGAWQVENMERLQDTGWVAVPEMDSLHLDRLYFQGIFGVLKGAHRRDRVTFELDSAAQALHITFITAKNERPIQRSWQFRQADSTHLSLTGKLWEDSVRLDCALRKELKRK